MAAFVYILLLMVMTKPLIVSGWAYGNVQKYPCNKYFYVMNGGVLGKPHPDGRRGFLHLPVLQDMKPLPGIFKDGDINITFSHTIHALNVPEGEHGKRKVDGNKYTIFVKDVYRDTLERKVEGDKYDIEMTFHYERSLDHTVNKEENIGISAIKFGEFVCPEPPKLSPKPTPPKCKIFMLDGSMPDGYRAFASLLVMDDMKEWTIKMKFPFTVRDFDTPVGDRVRVDDKSFTTTSLRHNGQQKSGHRFKFEYTVHYARGIENRRKITRIEFGNYVCEGAIIQRSVYWGK